MINWQETPCLSSGEECQSLLSVLAPCGEAFLVWGRLQTPTGCPGNVGLVDVYQAALPLSTGSDPVRPV